MDFKINISGNKGGPKKGKKYQQLVLAIADLLRETDQENRQDIVSGLERLVNSEEFEQVSKKNTIQMEVDIFDLLQLNSACIDDVNAQTLKLDAKIAAGGEPNMQELERVFVTLRTSSKIDNEIRKLLAIIFKGGDANG